MYLIHDHPSQGTIDHLPGPDIVEIGVTCVEGIAVITVVGELDVSNTERLNECLHAAIDAGALEMVVDIEHLTFMDSTGLSVLAGAHKRLSATGGTLTLLSPMPALERLFGAAHLVPAFNFKGAA
jgi:anti-anti-sigma factor